MARQKKEAPPPRERGTVKHGCCSCVHYHLPVKDFPCRDCERFNYWEDAKPLQAKPVEKR